MGGKRGGRSDGFGLGLQGRLGVEAELLRGGSNWLGFGIKGMNCSVASYLGGVHVSIHVWGRIHVRFLRKEDRTDFHANPNSADVCSAELPDSVATPELSLHSVALGAGGVRGVTCYGVEIGVSEYWDQSAFCSHVQHRGR